MACFPGGRPPAVRARFSARLIAVFAIAATWATGAYADGPWYITASVGVIDRETAGFNSAIRSTTSGISGSDVQHESFDTSVIGNLAVGYTILDHIRVENEFGYSNYDVTTLHPTNAPLFPDVNGMTLNRQSGGSEDQYSDTFNAFYDVPLGTSVVPYIGGGIGVIDTEYRRGFYTNGVGSLIHLGTSRTAGLALAEVGVAIPANGFSIVPAYRFLQSFGEGDRAPEVSAHVFKIGIRYAF